MSNKNVQVHLILFHVILLELKPSTSTWYDIYILKATELTYSNTRTASTELKKQSLYISLCILKIYLIMLSKLESIETIIFRVRNNCVVQVRAVQVITTFRICRIGLNKKIIYLQNLIRYLITALKKGVYSFPSYPKTQGYLCYLYSYHNFISTNFKDISIVLKSNL